MRKKDAETWINVAGHRPVHDSYYRYRMPQIRCHQEKNWTVVDNLTAVSNALHRQEGEVLNYLGVELCTQTTMFQASHGKRGPQTGCGVKGHHEAQVLQDKLRDYIQHFVLCSKCALPETAYRIKKKSGCIVQKCHACGFKTPLDMSHKVCGFITAAYKPAKQMKKGSRKKRSGATKEATEDFLGKKSDIEERRGKPGLGDRVKKSEVAGRGDKSVVANVKKREAGEETLDDKAAFAEAVQATRDFCQAYPGASSKELVRVVTREQKASVLLGRERIRILVHACLGQTGSSSFSDRKAKARQYAPVLERLVGSTGGLMSRYMQYYVMACLEEVCIPSDALKNSASFVVMLKELYDEDVLEEAAILEWMCGSRNDVAVVPEKVRAALRKTAEPFIAWLQQEAETESDDDEGKK